MAELTSKNDTLSLSLKKERETNRKERTVEKTLKNGNKQIKRVKPNVTVGTKEVTPDGKLVEYTVETLEGEVRHGKFNPASKKPLKTYDNSTGKDLLIEYVDGKAKSKKEVNAVKTQKKAPVIVDVNELGRTIHRTYSDGSKERIECNRGVTTRRKESPKDPSIYEYEATSNDGSYSVDAKNKDKIKYTAKYKDNSYYKESYLETKRSNNSWSQNNEDILNNLIKAKTVMKNSGIVYTIEKEHNRYGQQTGYFILTTQEPQKEPVTEKIDEYRLKQILKSDANKYSGGLSIPRQNYNITFIFPDSMMGLSRCK